MTTYNGNGVGYPFNGTNKVTIQGSDDQYNRDATLRLKRFEAIEKARKVASIETVILEFDREVSDLTREIDTEEQHTGIKNRAHVSYSTFAKAVRLRRSNLLASINALRLRLDVARREHENVVAELRKIEQS